MFGSRALQRLVEGTIRIAGELTVAIERTVQAEHALRAQRRADACEHRLHFRPAHDVRRVRAEDIVHVADGPGRIEHVQCDAARAGSPGRAPPTHSRMPGRFSSRSVAQPGPGAADAREMHRVLTGSGADLEHRAGRREPLLAGLRESGPGCARRRPSNGFMTRAGKLPGSAPARGWNRECHPAPGASMPSESR